RHFAAVAGPRRHRSCSTHSWLHSNPLKVAVSGWAANWGSARTEFVLLQIASLCRRESTPTVPVSRRHSIVGLGRVQPERFQAIAQMNAPDWSETAKVPFRADEQ